MYTITTTATTTTTDMHTPAADIGAADWRTLKRRVADAGCFRSGARRELCNIALVLTGVCAGYALLLMDPGWPARIGILSGLAIALVQSGLVGHEAGHGNITRNRTMDAAFGYVFMTLFTGVSHVWFRDTHREHHQKGFAVVLEPRGDQAPDRRYRRAARIIGYLLANALRLKIRGWMYIANEGSRAAIDALCLLAHVTAWLAVPALLVNLETAMVNYLLVTLLVGPYSGALLLAGHEGVAGKLAGKDSHWMHRQLASTRNLGSSRLAGILCGGVNHHVEHHLFPSVSRTRLGDARRVTRAVCRERGLPYLETSGASALASVWAHVAGRASTATTPRGARRL